MIKRSFLITAAAMLALVAGCANQKGPATKAIADAEAAIAAFKDDASRLLPNDLSSVETTVAGLKDNLAKGDFKAVLAAAPGLTTKITELRDATAAKKAEWEAATAAAKEQWTGYAADLPKMVEATLATVCRRSARVPVPAIVADVPTQRSASAWVRSRCSAGTMAISSSGITTCGRCNS